MLMSQPLFFPFSFSLAISFFFPSSPHLRFPSSVELLDDLIDCTQRSKASRKILEVAYQLTSNCRDKIIEHKYLYSIGTSLRAISTRTRSKRSVINRLV